MVLDVFHTFFSVFWTFIVVGPIIINTFVELDIFVRVFVMLMASFIVDVVTIDTMTLLGGFVEGLVVSMTFFSVVVGDNIIFIDTVPVRDVFVLICLVDVGVFSPCSHGECWCMRFHNWWALFRP